MLPHAGIEDLVDVLNIVSGVVEWENLGLQLGLLYNTLMTIRRDEKGETANCKRVMLASWLEKNDNVTKSGGPSWEQLATALRNINKLRLAEEVERKYLSMYACACVCISLFYI